MSNELKSNWPALVVLVLLMGCVWFLAINDARKPVSSSHGLECAYYDGAIYYNTSEKRIVEFSCE